MSKKVMNKENLRALMLKHRVFLKQLYSIGTIKSKKSLLLKSNVEQVDTLLNVLFYITQGDIPIQRSNFNLLSKHRVLPVLHNAFITVNKLTKLINSSLKEKTVFLLKFMKFYKVLLQPLFVYKKTVNGH